MRGTFFFTFFAFMFCPPFRLCEGTFFVTAAISPLGARNGRERLRDKRD